MLADSDASRDDLSHQRQHDEPVIQCPRTCSNTARVASQGNEYDLQRREDSYKDFEAPADVFWRAQRI